MDKQMEIEIGKTYPHSGGQAKVLRIYKDDGKDMVDYQFTNEFVTTPETQTLNGFLYTIKNMANGGVTIIDFNKEISDIANFDRLPKKVQDLIKSTDTISSEGFSTLIGSNGRETIWSAHGAWWSPEEVSKHKKYNPELKAGFMIDSIGDGKDIQWAESTMSKGGKAQEYVVSELSARLGIRKESIQKWLDKHNLSKEDGLRILTGLGRNHLLTNNVVTAIIGNENNEYSERLVEYVKSDKAYAMEKGGKTKEYTSIPEYAGAKDDMGNPVDTAQMDKWINENIGKVDDDKYFSLGMKAKHLRQLYYEKNKLGAYAFSYDFANMKKGGSMQGISMEDRRSTGDILLKDEGDFYYIYGETEKGIKWMKDNGYSEGNAISREQRARVSLTSGIEVEEFSKGGKTEENTNGFSVIYTNKGTTYTIETETKEQAELVHQALDDYRQRLIGKSELQNTLQSYGSDEDEVLEPSEALVGRKYYSGYFEKEIPILYSVNLDDRKKGKKEDGGSMEAGGKTSKSRNIGNIKNRISEDDFYSKYKPQTNHIVRKATPKSVADQDITSWSGAMYETYGPEEKYIINMSNDPKKKKKVWTIIEGDEGEMHIIAGYHYVNRQGYIVTDKEWKTGHEEVENDMSKGGKTGKKKVPVYHHTGEDKLVSLKEVEWKDDSTKFIIGRKEITGNVLSLTDPELYGRTSRRNNNTVEKVISDFEYAGFTDAKIISDEEFEKLNKHLPYWSNKYGYTRPDGISISETNYGGWRIAKHLPNKTLIMVYSDKHYTLESALEDFEKKYSEELSMYEKGDKTPVGLMERGGNLDDVIDSLKPGDRMTISKHGVESIIAERSIDGHKLSFVRYNPNGFEVIEEVDFHKRKELGGILIAGLIAAAIGGAAGYGYRDSITTAKEQAQKRVIKSKKETLDALNRRLEKAKAFKEDLKGMAISHIQRLEKGGEISYDEGSLIGKRIMFNNQIVDKGILWDDKENIETTGKIVDKVVEKGETAYIVEADETGELFILNLKEFFEATSDDNVGIVVTSEEARKQEEEEEEEEEKEEEEKEEKKEQEDQTPKEESVEEPVMAAGGFIGKGERVWNKLTSSKRMEFLYENFTPEITPRSQELLASKAYNFLPKSVKIKLEAKYANVEAYSSGGSVETGEQIDIWNSTIKIRDHHPDQKVRQQAALLLTQMNTAGGKELMRKEVEYFLQKNKLPSGGSMDKGSRIKESALDKLRHLLDDIAIDMEGEDEDALASLRHDLDEANTDQEAEKLISDFEKGMFNQIFDDNAKKEIKKAIADYRNEMAKGGKVPDSVYVKASYYLSFSDYDEMKKNVDNVIAQSKIDGSKMLDITLDENVTPTEEYEYEFTVDDFLSEIGYKKSCGGSMEKGGAFKVNKKYTHFAVNKETGKIVNGWETISDVDSLKHYAKTDLEDMDLKPSDYKILSAAALKQRGIDPFDWTSWENLGQTKISNPEVGSMYGGGAMEGLEVTIISGANKGLSGTVTTVENIAPFHITIKTENGHIIHGLKPLQLQAKSLMAAGGITKEEKEVLKEAKGIWEEKKNESLEALKNTDITQSDKERYESLLAEAERHLASFANGSMEKGGKTKEKENMGVDLFEDYEKIPAKVQKILDKYEDGFTDGDYDVLKKAHDEMEEIGYTFEYYLDGQAYDLRKIGEVGNVEYAEKHGIGIMAKGGKVGSDFYTIKYWETREKYQRPDIFNEMSDVFKNKKKAIDFAEKLFHNKSYYGVEVVDSNGESVYHISEEKAKGGEVENWDSGVIEWINKNKPNHSRAKTADGQKQLAEEIGDALNKSAEDKKRIYNFLSGYFGTPFMYNEEEGKYYVNKKYMKQGGKTEDAGKISSAKKKLLDDIKTLQDAFDNSLLDDETKGKIPAKIEAKKKKIADLDEEERIHAEKEKQKEEKAAADKALKDQELNKQRLQKEAVEREKKLRTQSLKNKNIYIDIDKQLKEKMRNAIHAEQIPYESRTDGDVFRVFLSNSYQLDIVGQLYNEKRKKLDMEPVSKEQVANVIKKRVGKLKFMPIKVKPNLKDKLPIEKKRSVKKVEKKRGGVKGKSEENTEG